MKRTLKEVSIKDIRIDGGTQARVDVDPHWVHGMVDNMKNDVVYDAVEARFDGTCYWLTDGFHRYHAYLQLGIKNIEVLYLPGTQFDAQLDALAANDKHGKPLTRADKEKKVRMALENPLIEDKSDYAIAKLCKVSRSFVGAVRDPKIKEKQAEAKKQHYLKKDKNIGENTEENDEKRSPTTLSKPETPNLQEGLGPDAAEIEANERAFQADQAIMYELLESDDALATAHQEIKRLNLLNAQYEVRINALNSERNEAIKMVKKLQKELDKLKGKK